MMRPHRFSSLVSGWMQGIFDEVSPIATLIPGSTGLGTTTIIE
jgi:hypothetical protein